MNTEELERLATVRRLVATGEARRRRVAASLSLGEVAGACGVDSSTVSRWETGVRRPRGTAALRYGHVLDLVTKEACSALASA